MDFLYHGLAGALISRAATDQISSGVVVASILPDIVGMSLNYSFKFVDTVKNYKNKGFLKTYIHKLTSDSFQNKIDKNAYRFTHSILGLLFFGLVMRLYIENNWILLTAGYASHLLIDIPTHTGDWATRLLYPFSDLHFKIYKNRWFNKRMFINMYLSMLLAWVIILAI